jgi:hypothetical protein
MKRWAFWVTIVCVLGIGLYTTGVTSFVQRKVWEWSVPLKQAADSPLTWEAVQVRPEHPRLFITRDNLDEQRQRLNPHHPAWQGVMSLARQGNAAAAGLCYQMTGQREFADIAARSLRAAQAVDTQYALAFDWAFSGWDNATQTEMIRRFVNAVGLREGQMPFVSSYCNLNHPLPSQTAEERWENYYNWTFHSEDWADCSQLGAERYSPYFALAGHHPQATRAAQAIWEMSFKDPTLFLGYLGDGGFWEGGYWAPRGKVAKMASVFAMTHSSAGLGKEALPFLRNIGYFLLYQTDLATGQLTMPYGDSDLRNSREWQVRHAMLATNYFARQPVYQWYLNHLTTPAKPLEEAVWFDPRMSEEHPRALPPTRLFPHSKMVLFRSGWEGKGDCIGMFRVGDWFDIHNHHDAGHFMLYKDGLLVGKAGFYGEQFANAAQHNTLALEPPDVRNGGQRQYRRTWSFRIGRKAWLRSREHFRRGDVLKFESADDYDYVAADVTPAYPPENVKEFTRQIVFLRPGALVVFDRVKTAARVTQKFLAHVVSQPRLGNKLLDEATDSANDATLTSRGAGSPTLAMRTLLPQCAKIRAVREVGSVAPWRVEVMAALPQERSHFLHLLYPTNDGTPLPTVKMSEERDKVSLEIRWQKRVYRMTFRKEGRVEGGVEVSEW